MESKYILAFCCVLATASAASVWGGGWQPGDNPNPWAPGGGINPWVPSWIASAPWFPQWTACSTIGSTCSDCTTRLICTKIGGMQRACTDPSLPYCNLGQCSATPTEECQPPTVPAVTDNA